MGIGIIAGSEPEAARELSIIDAACVARLPEAAAWEPRLLEEESALAARDLEESSRVARTRVAFESMDREASS